MPVFPTRFCPIVVAMDLNPPLTLQAILYAAAHLVEKSPHAQVNQVYLLFVFFFFFLQTYFYFSISIIHVFIKLLRPSFNAKVQVKSKVQLRMHVLDSSVEKVSFWLVVFANNSLCFTYRILFLWFRTKICIKNTPSSSPLPSLSVSTDLEVSTPADEYFKPLTNIRKSDSQTVIERVLDEMCEYVDKHGGVDETSTGDEETGSDKEKEVMDKIKLLIWKKDILFIK